MKNKLFSVSSCPNASNNCVGSQCWTLSTLGAQSGITVQGQFGTRSDSSRENRFVERPDWIYMAC